MRKRIRNTLLLILLLMTVPAVLFMPAQESNAEENTIRVLLSVAQTNQLNMAVKGAYVISETGDSFSGGTISLYADGSKVTVSHSKSGELYTGRKVHIVRTNENPGAGSMTFEVDGHTRSYLGSFTISSASGRVRIVNEVSLTQYLYGVIGYEMSNTWPVEALKAQSVAAKNYVLAKSGSGGTYDVKDNATDQVYKGYLSSMTNVISAVDATEGEALYLGDQLIPCYYSASNGGYTILPSENWGETVFDAAYVAGTDPFDLRNTASRTESLYIPQDLARRSFSSTALYNFTMSKLDEARLREGSVSEGRVFDSYRKIDSIISTNDKGEATADGNHSLIVMNVTMQVKEDPALGMPSPTPSPEPESPETEDDMTEEEYEPDNPEIRTAGDPFEEKLVVTIPFSEMVSAGLFQDTSLRIFYVISAEGGWKLFHGRFGHGVGMSQRGAQQMAKEGWTHEQILAFYYPGAELRHGKTIAAEGAVTTIEQDTEPAGESEAEELSVETEEVEIPGTEQEETERIPESNDNATVLTETVLYSGADENTRVVGTVAAGTSLQATALAGEWYLVRNNVTGQVGYVFYSDLFVNGDTGLAIGRITGSLVNMRSGPGTDYESIGKLDRNEKISICEFVPDWYRVRSSSGAAGYVAEQYVTVLGGPEKKNREEEDREYSNDAEEPVQVEIRVAATPEPEAVPVEFYASGIISAERVTLRRGPSVSAAGLLTLESGGEVRIYEKCGGWYRVRVTETGQEGYIFARYITLRTMKEGTEQITTAKTITGGVNLRSAPAVSSRSIAMLPKNTLVTVTGTDGSWVKILVANTGETGFVLGMYLDFDIVGVQKGNTGAASQAIVNAGILNLYDKPDTEKGKVIMRIRRGYTVTVCSVADGWSIVQFNGEQGYCKTKYLTLQ